MAATKGTATLDFGTGLAAVTASVDVTGQSGFTSSSHCDAWLRIEATADHSTDEVLLEQIKIRTAYVSAGTFRIHGEVLSGSAWGRFNINWVWCPA